MEARRSPYREVGLSAKRLHNAPEDGEDLGVTIERGDNRGQFNLGHGGRWHLPRWRHR